MWLQESNLVILRRTVECFWNLHWDTDQCETNLNFLLWLIDVLIGITSRLISFKTLSYTGVIIARSCQTSMISMEMYISRTSGIVWEKIWKFRLWEVKKNEDGCKTAGNDAEEMTIFLSWLQNGTKTSTPRFHYSLRLGNKVMKIWSKICTQYSCFILSQDGISVLWGNTAKATILSRYSTLETNLN